MAQAPGFQMTGYDVGGSRTGTQTGYQTYGVSGQNKTLFEGINVTEGQDANAGYFDFGSFEEMQLGGSGNMGEQSGVGAFLNLTVKSGGDKFNAQVYYDYVGEQTLSNNVPDAFRTPGGDRRAGIQGADDHRSGDWRAARADARQPDHEAVRLQRQRGRTDQEGPALVFRELSRQQPVQDDSRAARARRRRASSSTRPPRSPTSSIGRTRSSASTTSGRSSSRFRDLSLAIPVSAANWQRLEEPAAEDRVDEHVEQPRVPRHRSISHWGNYFPLYPTQTQSTSTEGVPVGRLDLDDQPAVRSDRATTTTGRR